MEPLIIGLEDFIQEQNNATPREILVKSEFKGRGLGGGKKVVKIFAWLFLCEDSPLFPPM